MVSSGTGIFNGTPLLRHRGILETKDLVAVIQALPADMSELNRLDRILKTDKNNFEALRELGARLRKRLRAAGLYQSSNEFYDRAITRDQARKNPVLREALLLDMGLNFLELREAKQAILTFERCLKEFSNSENRPRFIRELARARELLAGR